jgi:hypothetical protein
MRDESKGLILDRIPQPSSLISSGGATCSQRRTIGLRNRRTPYRDVRVLQTTVSLDLALESKDAKLTSSERSDRIG